MKNVPFSAMDASYVVKHFGCVSTSLCWNGRWDLEWGLSSM